MQQIVNAAPTPGEGDRVQGIISALVSAGLEGGYLANPRLARVHWQAGDRPLPPPRVSVAGESALWVDPAEIPASEDIGPLRLLWRFWPSHEAAAEPKARLGGSHTRHGALPVLRGHRRRDTIPDVRRWQLSPRALPLAPPRFALGDLWRSWRGRPAYPWARAGQADPTAAGRSGDPPLSCWLAGEMTLLTGRVRQAA